MSFQVGGSCYATVADAAVAVCAAHVPTAVVSGTSIITLSCAGTNAAGGISWSAFTCPTNSGLCSLTRTNPRVHTMEPVFAPCRDQEYLDVMYALLPVVLGIFASVWGLWMAIRALRWSRGGEA